MKYKKPDHHEAALKVVAVIESCKTMQQFRAAEKMVEVYNNMFKGKWDWVYWEDFYEAMCEKFNELKDVNVE